MKKLLLVLLVVGLVACKSAQDKAKEQIKTAEKSLVDSKTKFINPETAVALLKAYMTYVEKYPQDTTCADFLFKAAEVSSGLRLSGQAVELYKRCYGEYPEWRKAPQAMFLHAFTLETQMSDYFHANIQYQRFIDKYPNHPLAKDAHFMMENMGKTDEELVKSFEEKNK